MARVSNEQATNVSATSDIGLSRFLVDDLVAFLLSNDVAW
jgi:hypothetical protein